MAELKERDGKNLLHLAAGIAAKEDDTRFFIRLLDLHFPLYTPDLDFVFPAFLIVGVKTDSKFASCFNALVLQGFDLNHPNKDNITFLEYLFLKTPSECFDLNKVKSILQTQPFLDQSIINSLDSKLAFNWVRHNRPEIRSAENLLKKYL